MKKSPEFKYKSDAEKFKKEVPKAEQEIAMKVFEEENKEESKDKELKNKAENKEKPELEAIPIFRDNDLYVEMFPEIKPALEKGEEPTLKKVLNAIIQHRNKTIILDKTCAYALSNFYDDDAEKFTLKLSDFPKEFELSKLPIGSIDEIEIRIKELLKQKFNISVSEDTIDQKIEGRDGAFSAELVGDLLRIAKQKNKNIKNIFILTENISDHALIDEDGKKIIPNLEFGSDYRVKAKKRVINTLVDEVKKNFGMEPIIVDVIDKYDIHNGDHIIADRHNPIIRADIFKEKPTQFSVLPLETELYYNEKYLGNPIGTNKLVDLFRKKFEKKEEK